MEYAKRPPIGIMPKRHWLARRAADLQAAIERYVAAGETPSREWFDELEEIGAQGIVRDLDRMARDGILAAASCAHSNCHKCDLREAEEATARAAAQLGW